MLLLLSLCHDHQKMMAVPESLEGPRVVVVVVVRLRVSSNRQRKRGQTHSLLA
jgi:hypothetical protein